MKRASSQHGVDPLLSVQVGEFVIQERIGSGGMGVVYRASHPLIGKEVAVKVLRPEHVTPELVERLLIEARAVNAIRHPGIIDIFGFGKLPDGRPYITMELLLGVTLGGLIRHEGRLDVGTTVWVLDQMLAALGAAHRAGVVHRDLKPGNVFLAGAVEGARTLKLVDFGIAKLMQAQKGPTTADGAILGTPEYMAPEQIRGKPVSPATDLYAVGIMAFQMLTGARPFNGEPLKVMFAHVEETPPLPSSRAAGVPPELDTLVRHLLAKDPALRPESAEAVRQALKRVPVSQPEVTRSLERRPEATRSLASPVESETRTLDAPRLPQPAPAPAATRAFEHAPIPAPAATRVFEHASVPAPPATRGLKHWRRVVIGAALLAGLAGGGLFVASVVSRGPAPVPIAVTPLGATEGGDAQRPQAEPVKTASPSTEDSSGASKPKRREQAVGAHRQPVLAPGPRQPKQDESPRPSPGVESAVVETPAPTPVVNNSTPPPTPSGKTAQERVKDLQQGLIHEIDQAEQWLRARKGDVANGSTGMVALQFLRQRAQSAVTAEERASIRKDLSLWKQVREGEGASPK